MKKTSGEIKLFFLGAGSQSCVVGRTYGCTQKKKEKVKEKIRGVCMLNIKRRGLQKNKRIAENFIN